MDTLLLKKLKANLIAGGVVKPSEITNGVVQIQTMGSGGEEPFITGGGIINSDEHSGNNTPSYELFVQTADWKADGISYSTALENGNSVSDSTFSTIYKNGYNNSPTSAQISVAKNTSMALYIRLSEPKFIETFKMVAYNLNDDDTSYISISAFNDKDERVYSGKIQPTNSNDFKSCKIDSVVSRFGMVIYGSASYTTGIRAIKIN